MQEKKPQTEPGDNRSRDAEPTRAGMPAPEDQLPPLSFWRLPVALFAYPRMALLNARIHKLWGKALMLTILVTAIAAAILAVQTAPQVRKQMNDLNELFETTLGELTFDAKTKTIGWTKELKTPVTRKKHKWQLDVLHQLSDFDAANARDGLQPAGIVVAKDGISAWMRNSFDHSITRLQGIPQESIWNLFEELGEDRNGTRVLTKRNIERLTPLIAPIAAVTVAIATAIYNLKMIITCVGLFVIMSLLFNRADKASFGAVCASSLACTFPPFTLALFVSLIPVFRVDVDTLFTVFFVIYLIVIILDRSVVIRRIQK